MALYNFHRVLIAATALFDAAFSIWCLSMGWHTGESIYWLMLVGSSVLSVSFILYLLRFHRKTQWLEAALQGRACPNCGHDLTASAVTPNCPECGGALTNQMRRAGAAFRPRPNA